MSDYIDRQDAINAIYHYFPHMGSMKLAATVLHEVPSAEPEIVRCKDCKYYVIHTLFGRSQAWCERLCDEFDKSLAHGVESDDYCSRAERRTDE